MNELFGWWLEIVYIEDEDLQWNYTKQCHYPNKKHAKRLFNNYKFNETIIETRLIHNGAVIETYHNKLMRDKEREEREKKEKGE